jgi:dynein light intermediate chain 2
MHACRTMFTRLGFGGGPPVDEIEFDSSKPLCVPTGADSVKVIGHLDGMQGSESGSRISSVNVVQMWKSAYEQTFPPSGTGTAAGGVAESDGSSLSQHPEAAIDAMRRQKDEELEKYREKARRRARQLAERREQAAASGAVKPRKPTGAKTGGGPRRGGRARRSAAPTEGEGAATSAPAPPR